MASETRARLYTAIGAALGTLATLGVTAAKQAGALEQSEWRLVALTMAPPVLAMLGLRRYDAEPRQGGTLVVAAAGLLMGLAAVLSADGTGLLWMPGALLLVLGAFGLVEPLRPSRRR